MPHCGADLRVNFLCLECREKRLAVFRFAAHCLKPRNLCKHVTLATSVTPAWWIDYKRDAISFASQLLIDVILEEASIPIFELRSIL